MIDFIEKLKKIFLNNRDLLPGRIAHEIMLPRPSIDTSNLLPLQESGVLILIFPCNNDPCSILIKRTSKGPHGNQISLPGGKRESGEDLETTAKRETEEEIGVPASKIKIIGRLSKLIINVSSNIVFPFVGFIDFTPVFKINKNEVKYIIKYNIEEFVKTCEPKIKVVNYNNLNREIPYFQINDEIIWGATAMILNEFKMILNTYK